MSKWGSCQKLENENEILKFSSSLDISKKISVEHIYLWLCHMFSKHRSLSFFYYFFLSKNYNHGQNIFETNSSFRAK